MGSSPLAFVLLSSESGFLEELLREKPTGSEKENPDQITFGEIAKAAPQAHLDFDPKAVIDAVYQVLTVVATVGGTIQFIGWVVGKIEAARQAGVSRKVAITRGSMVATVSTENTKEENQKVLAEVLLDKKA